jgi:ADP-ribose pyrophosphatase YjhB (NUDIX family)
MPISSYLRRLRGRLGSELLLMPSVTGMVWNSKQELLLLRQAESSLWNLPGGIVDPGEHPAEALVREVREETGIIVRPQRILGVFGGPQGFRRTYPNGDQMEFIDILFKCDSIGGKLQCLDGEAVEARFLDRHALMSLPLDYPVTFETLRDKNQPVFFWDDNWISKPID